MIEKEKIVYFVYCTVFYVMFLHSENAKIVILQRWAVTVQSSH